MSASKNAGSSNAGRRTNFPSSRSALIQARKFGARLRRRPFLLNSSILTPEQWRLPPWTNLSKPTKPGPKRCPRLPPRVPIRFGQKNASASLRSSALPIASASNAALPMILSRAALPSKRTAGALVYWDDTNKRCTTVATLNLLIGVATIAVVRATPSEVGCSRLQHHESNPAQ